MHRKPAFSAVTFVVAAALALGVTPSARADEDLLGRPIVAIDFDCAAPIDESGLRQLLPLRVGEALTAAALETAQARLAATDIFPSIRLEPQARDGGVAIVAHLIRKAVVNTIRFHGNHAIGDDELRRHVSLRENVPFTDELRDHSVKRIRDHYVEAGFEQVEITAVVRERRPGEVDVTFRIAESEPLRVVAVDVTGDVPLPEAKVRHAIGIKPGDRYVRAKQRAAQTAIVRLLRDANYYEALVESSWDKGDARGGVLRFTLRAGPPFAITFSGNQHFGDAKLLGLMDLPKRPIVTDGTWRELSRRARRAYQEDGFYFARVDVRIEPGPPKHVRFDVNEGQPFRVGAVEFEGNRSLSAHVLQSEMATRPPSWIPWRRGAFLDDVLDDDLKRLWYLYRRHGFAAARVEDARVRFDAEQHLAFPTVVIAEGRQTIVRAIERIGIEVIAAKLPQTQLAAGDELDPDRVEADRRALLGAFAQAGYAQAAVRVEVHGESGGDTEQATVRFVAVAGEAQHVGAIIVQNNIDTRARVITRELPFKSGDPLNPDLLLQGQANIYRLGLFRSVTVRPVESEPSAVRDIGVNVAEKPAGTIQWGAGYNTRDGLRGFTEVGYANLQGLARRVSLRGEFNFDPTQATPNDYVGNLGGREPHLGDSAWVLRANLIGQRSTRAIDQFSLERLAFIPAVERPLLPNLQTGFELQVEQSRVFDVAPDVLAFNPRDAGELRTISLGPYAIYDGRDDPFVPRRGLFDSVRLRVAPAALGSQVPFTKLLAQHTHYIPLDDDLTFVYAARGGWAQPLAGGDTIPIRERFFLGGRTTVRGFGENTIGPMGTPSTNAQGNLVPGGDPLGGDLLLNLNTELRFPLLYGFGGVVFADGGGVYLHDRAISLHDFRRSTGVGLRYNTPVGPVSLEYGFKLDRRADESLGEVHFSIGTIF